MRSSRLTKSVKKKNEKTIILSILGIVVVLFLLFKFGIEALVNFSVFISSSKSQTSQSENSNEINFLSPPVLNPVTTATNSAQIIITGNADPKAEITLYLNNVNVDSVITDNDGKFSFSENLKEGSNNIRAIAKLNKKESESSEIISVNYIKSNPKLDISTPNDGQNFKKVDTSALVSGQTDQGVSVTVNGFFAALDNNNNFSYNLPLKDGDNEIKIIATDQAGNKSEKSLKVNYSQ